MTSIDIHAEAARRPMEPVAVAFGLGAVELAHDVREAPRGPNHDLVNQLRRSLTARFKMKLGDTQNEILRLRNRPR